MKTAVFINIPEDAYKTNFIYQKLQTLAFQKDIDMIIEVEGFENATIISEEELQDSWVVLMISDEDYSKERFTEKPVIRLTSEEAMKNAELIYDLAFKALEP